MAFWKPKKIETQEKKDNSITLGELFEKKGITGIKMRWSDFKNLDKVCSVEGKESKNCKEKTKEYGIEWIGD